jgi:hypothetical protein
MKTGSHRIANLKADKICGRKKHIGDALLLLLLLMLLLLELANVANAQATAVTYSSSPFKMTLRAAFKNRRVILDHSPIGKLDRLEERSLACEQSSRMAQEPEIMAGKLDRFGT